MDPKLWELLEEGHSDDEVAAIIRSAKPGSLPPGIRVVAQLGEIVTVRLQRGSILSIREDVEVASFKAPGPSLGPDVELDDLELADRLPDWPQPSDERRPATLAATGRGVVIGIVDWGFDIAHPDFCYPDGSTRILALWDQRGGPNTTSPQPYGYGRLHTREAINQALITPDPYTTLGYHPADADTGRGAHGTLVASIAAGNGAGGGPLGIAPEAELVFVHLATWEQDRSAKLGNSVTLLEAIDFIAQTAGERPWVINLSMGRCGEPHDGTTLSEQGLDAVLRAAPGRAICQSTGNYYTRQLHASGRLRPGEERTLVWQIAETDVTPNELEIWYSGRDTMAVAIQSPDGEQLAWLKLGERSPLIVNGSVVGRAYHRATDPNNLDHHIDIIVQPKAPAGPWAITLIAADVVDGRFHAWIERDAACPHCQSHFRPADADPTSTTGTICNGLRTIAVGAYDPHHPNQPVASFSSTGPTRDGRLKPDLCAPGVNILGARSAQRDPNGQTPLLTRMSGTSFAAPHVTGCVALMFQVAPRPLRIEEVHTLLLASTRKVSFPTDPPGRTGSGYLDIERAVDAAQRIGRIGPQLTLASIPEEAAMLDEEAIELPEFVAGKAADDAEEAPSGHNTFHRIANDITSVFEGGQTGTLNLYDNGIISYGKHQATLASGTLAMVLKRYTELSASGTAQRMTTYLDRVEQRDASLRQDNVFIKLLKDAAQEPEMSQAQDEVFTRHYWEPAKKAAKEANITSALGHVILYDTLIQGGMQPVLRAARNRLGGKIGDTIRGTQITEQAFLRVFMDERIKRLLRISNNQTAQAKQLNEAASELERQASIEPDPQQAQALRTQANTIRKKATQLANNAAALDRSARSIRCPSLMALVEAGDLDLFGDAEGKIYLTGKPGVVINGLRPGATVDPITVAEDVAMSAASEEALPKYAFVIISGGPGPYDQRDIEHDQSWANYVTPPLLLKPLAERNEAVWWFVYKPAYKQRWMEDCTSSSAARRNAAKQVERQGHTSYIDLIESRAKARGWNLHWLLNADDLWRELTNFSANSISRVWYWGHARDDLWLTIRHSPTTGAAIEPPEDAIVAITSIDHSLTNRFRKGESGRMHRFIGCNTSRFAKAWATAFNVWTEGIEGKINFASIHQTGGEPCLVDRAQVISFSPGGKEEPVAANQRPRIKPCPARTQAAELREERILDGEAEVLVAETPASAVWAASPSEREQASPHHPSLVERADAAISRRAISHRPSALLEYVLAHSDATEALGGVYGRGRTPLLAAIFDAFVYDTHADMRPFFNELFQVIAMPKTLLAKEVQAGDLMIRRCEEGFAHLSIIVSTELFNYKQLTAAGIKAEHAQPGQYVRVVEGGAFPHNLADNFARRITDVHGFVLSDTLVLRLRTGTPAVA